MIRLRVQCLEEEPFVRVFTYKATVANKHHTKHTL